MSENSVTLRVESDEKIGLRANGPCRLYTTPFKGSFSKNYRSFCLQL